MQERYISYYEKPWSYRYAICIKETNRLIGYIAVSDSDNFDLGYAVSKEHWGKGYATEAALAVVERLKAAAFLYITATHDVNNPKSGDVMKCIGMQYRYSYEELWQPKNLVKEHFFMITPYLTFRGECEDAFNFYADAFGGGKTDFARLDNDPNNPIMHAIVSFTKLAGCIMGADIKEPVVISGMAICVVLPSREAIEEISVKLAEGGNLVQGFLPHPPPHQNDGGAEVLDNFGCTWYLST